MKTLIETDRLLLGEAVPDDSPFILTLLNSPTWLEFIGDRGIKDQKDAQNYIEQSLISSYANHGFGLYMVRLKENNEPIGLCGYLKRDYLDFPDLGFALLSDYEGYGFMQEASDAVLLYGKSKLKIDEVLAMVLPTNTKSQKLLKRLGFYKIGTVEPDVKEPPSILLSNKKSHSN